LVGGVAVYLLGLVAFRYRHIQTINPQRFAIALLLLALYPVALELSALVMLALLNVLLWYDDRLRDPGLWRGPRGGPARDAAPARRGTDPRASWQPALA
jgi:hypothetical protein